MKVSIALGESQLSALVSQGPTEIAEEVLRGILELLVTQLKLRTFPVHKQVTLVDTTIFSILEWLHNRS